MTEQSSPVGATVVDHIEESLGDSNFRNEYDRLRPYEKFARIVIARPHARAGTAVRPRGSRTLGAGKHLQLEVAAPLPILALWPRLGVMTVAPVEVGRSTRSAAKTTSRVC